MPLISTFLGIAIRIYFTDHNPPHFHVSYVEFEAIIEINTGKVLHGKLPPKAASLVQEWRKKNRNELTKAWELASKRKTPKRIKGLN